MAAKRLIHRPPVVAGVAVLVLCALTYVALAPAWRYTTLTSVPIDRQVLSAGLDRWHHNGVAAAVEDGAVTVRLQGGPQGRVHVMTTRVAMPPGSDALRIHVQGRAEQITPGPSRWQAGLVQVWHFDAAGGFLWYWPKSVASLSGDAGWETFEAVIPVTRDVAASHLAIANVALSGTLLVREVAVAALKERWTSAIASAVLIALWAFAAIWVCRAVLRARSVLAARVFIVALGAITLAAVITPQPYFERASAPVHSFIRAIVTPPEQGPAQAGIRAGEAAHGAPRVAQDGLPVRFSRSEEDHFRIGFKDAGHFAVFFLLAVAAAAAYPQAGSVVTVLYLAIFALATECLQLFPITRSPSLSDLAIDVFGVVVGTATVAALRIAVSALRRPRSRSASPGAGS